MQEEGWKLKQSSVVFSSASTQTNTSFPTKQPSQEKNIYEGLGTIKNDQDENRMVEGAAKKAKLKTIQDNSIQRRLHPECKEDVRLLYSELNLWRKKQLDEIEQMRDIDSENRIKMRGDVLSKETILLRKINSINQGLTASQKKAKIDNVLSQMVTPRRWKLSSGEEIEVQTADMGHSSKLVQIFQRLDHSKAAELNGMLSRIIMPVCFEYSIRKEKYFLTKSYFLITKINSLSKDQATRSSKGNVRQQRWVLGEGNM